MKMLVAGVGKVKTAINIQDIGFFQPILDDNGVETDQCLVRSSKMPVGMVVDIRFDDLLEVISNV